MLLGLSSACVCNSPGRFRAQPSCTFLYIPAAPFLFFHNSDLSSRVICFWPKVHPLEFRGKLVGNHFCLKKFHFSFILRRHSCRVQSPAGCSARCQSVVRCVPAVSTEHPLPGCSQDRLSLDFCVPTVTCLHTHFTAVQEVSCIFF